MADMMATLAANMVGKHLPYIKSLPWCFCAIRIGGISPWCGAFTPPVGIAGVFFLVPWFFMDFKNAEAQEHEAYRKRYNHLFRFLDEFWAIFRYRDVEELWIFRIVPAAVTAFAGLLARRGSRGRGGRKRARGALRAARGGFRPQPEDGLIEGGLEVILLLKIGRYLLRYPGLEGAMLRGFPGLPGCGGIPVARRRRDTGGKDPVINRVATQFRNV